MLTNGTRPHRNFQTKRPMWILVLLALVCFSLIGAYVYPPKRYSTCYFFASSMCTPFKDWLPARPTREKTDEELVASVVMRDILMMPMPKPRTAKIAFMFLSPGSLPFEKLWERFFSVSSFYFLDKSHNNFRVQFWYPQFFLLFFIILIKDYENPQNGKL